MTMYAIHDDGRLVSVGSVLADPLPEHLTALELDADQAALACTGGVWDSESRSFASPVAEAAPDPAALVAQARQAVAGYSDGNGTKKAVQALADAVEAMR